MSTEKKTDATDPAAQMVELLKGIQAELQGLRGDVRATNARLEDLKTRFDRTDARMDVGFAQTNARFDRMDAKLDDVQVEARGFLTEIMGDTRQIREALRLPVARKRTRTGT
jgi:hypothetical protein